MGRGERSRCHVLPPKSKSYVIIKFIVFFMDLSLRAYAESPGMI
jgi:hypothetical protein